MSKLLFDVSSAAHALSLSPQDIRALIHIGELRPIEVRGRDLIHREELIRFARPAVRRSRSTN